MKKLLGLVSMGGLAIALTLAMVAQAPRPSLGTKIATAAPSGARDGIRVHGHWTIVVKNPDGSVAARREFENTLQFDGSNLLPLALGGFVTPGRWQLMIGLDANSANTTTFGPCGGGGQEFVLAGGTQSISIIQPCGISATAQILSSTIANPLQTQGPAFPAQIQAANLQLSGTVAVTNSGYIDQVATLQVPCSGKTSGTGVQSVAGYPLSSLTAASNISPADCQNQVDGTQVLKGSGFDNFFFTYATLGSSVKVVPQQTVEVTVVISFS